jgi:hypothetical protein
MNDQIMHYAALVADNHDDGAGKGDEEEEEEEEDEAQDEEDAVDTTDDDSSPLSLILNAIRYEEQAIAAQKRRNAALRIALRKLVHKLRPYEQRRRVARPPPWF